MVNGFKGSPVISTVSCYRPACANLSCLLMGGGGGIEFCSDALTPIGVVPAPTVVLIEYLARLVGLQQSVYTVQLSPGQGMDQHLPSLVDTEISRSQKSQNVCIFWNLKIRHNSIHKYFKA